MCSFFSVNSRAEQIRSSSWSFGEEEASKEEEKPISVDLLETIELRAAELEARKVREEAEMQRQIAEMKVKRKTLMECLEQRGVILFTLGDGDCKACKKQRAYFGEDFKDLNFVDCQKSTYVCSLLRNIKAYPTWYLGRNLGVKKGKDGNYRIIFTDIDAGTYD